jgi:hypothetical protein
MPASCCDQCAVVLVALDLWITTHPPLTINLHLLLGEVNGTVVLAELLAHSALLLPWFDAGIVRHSNQTPSIEVEQECLPEETIRSTCCAAA